MKRCVVLVAVVALCEVAALAPQAQAEPDEVDLRPTATAHRVTGKRTGRYIDFTVSRRIENPHATATDVDFLWRLPPHGAVTNLRWRREDDPSWVNAQVMPAKAASALYERYLQGPVELDRGPLLATDEQLLDGTGLHIESPTLAPHRALLLEYRVTVALCYVNGNYITPYPYGELDPEFEASTDDGTAAVRFVDVPALVVPNARILAALPEADADCGISSDNPPGWRYVEFANQVPEGIRPALERIEVVAGGASQLVIDVGKQLEPAPHRANVVFVIDASRSVSQATVAQQFTMAKEFLQALPDAKFNVIMTRRKPTLLWPQFQPANAATQLDKLSEEALAVGNGSNFDAALRLAATTLHNAPASSSSQAYVIGFTDARWRTTLAAPQLPTTLAGLPSQSIVHITTIAEQPPRASLRWDYHPACDPIAAAFGQRWRGMITMLSDVACDGSSEDVDHASQPALPLQWVRPMVIEKLTADGTFMQDQLAEGQRLNFLSNDAGARVSILQGLIWGQPWTMAATANDYTSHYFAAIAHTTDLGTTMNPDEATQIALAGHAISPSTSMLAIDARFGPTRQDNRRGFGFGSTGSAIDGCCGVDTIGHGRPGRMVTPTITNEQRVANVATRCAADLKLNHWWVQIEAELTGDEIVDVRAISSDGAPFKHCVIEGVWEVSAVNPQNIDTISVIAQNH
jgi:hypothetical protein